MIWSVCRIDLAIVEKQLDGLMHPNGPSMSNIFPEKHATHSISAMNASKRLGHDHECNMAEMFKMVTLILLPIAWAAFSEPQKPCADPLEYNPSIFNQACLVAPLKRAQAQSIQFPNHLFVTTSSFLGVAVLMLFSEYPNTLFDDDLNLINMSFAINLVNNQIFLTAVAS